MIVKAIIATIVVGYLGAGFIGAPMNWPDAGAIFAVATMGGFILNEIKKKDK